MRDAALRNLVIAACRLVMVGVAVTAPASGNAVDFDYDIFLVGDTVAIWIDIRPVMTQSKMEDLAAGLDISILIEVKVERPRKLLLTRTVGSAGAALLISHRLTEDSYRLTAVNYGRVQYEFPDQLELSAFLADSLVIRVVPAAIVRDAGNPRLDLTIVTESHSPHTFDEEPWFRRNDSPDDRAAEKEFFESLFDLFLRLIDFGTTTYNFTTPEFSLDDLSPL